MEELIELLKESADVYKIFIDLEYKKYDIVIKNNIESLNEIISKEQAIYLKMRGLEQKREKFIDSMGMHGKTLKEIINLIDKDQDILLAEYERFNGLISEAKKTSELCKTLIEVRLHRIDKVMSQLGEKENTYTNNENKNINSKSFIISKKI